MHSCRRPRDGDPTIFLFAELPAMPPCNVDGMNDLLGKVDAVDNPGAHVAPFSHIGQHTLPGLNSSRYLWTSRRRRRNDAVTDAVHVRVAASRSRPSSRGICGHLIWVHQTSAVGTERRKAVGMAQRTVYALYVNFKSILTRCPIAIPTRDAPRV